VDVTRKTRDFMEANPTLREPESFKEFPGKMDHATCVCLSVGFTPKSRMLLTRGRLVMQHISNNRKR
jgi:hypothetical protein